MQPHLSDSRLQGGLEPICLQIVSDTVKVTSHREEKSGHQHVELPDDPSHELRLTKVAYVDIHCAQRSC